MRRAAAVALCGIALTLAALTFDAAPLFVDYLIRGFLNKLCDALDA